MKNNEQEFSNEYCFESLEEKLRKNNFLKEELAENSEKSSILNEQSINEGRKAKSTQFYHISHIIVGLNKDLIARKC